MAAGAKDGDAQDYALALLEEECCEVIIEIMKSRRFGLDTRGPRGTSPRLRLERELGDIMAAVSYAIERGIVSAVAVAKAKEGKLDMLLNHICEDGRKLAP